AAGHQQTQARFGAAADASAQLMQLRDAEAVGVHDHHDRGIGHVDADFDHGGGHEYVEGSPREIGHDVVFVLGGHPSVQHADTQIGHRPVREFGEQAQHVGGVAVIVVGLDTRHDDIGL